ncbi:ribosome biogenesis protein [archaeon]|jgi:H/ACA ribonucleoprotein complex subunit 3|nr:ribosome biogenesis protein [archaeon]MBT6698045.1 ribosome biogenesis protein [archaeon]
MKKIHKCTNKECNTYTIKEICPKCNSKTLRPMPPKFSPEDKYADLKRQAKEQERKQKGLIK